jgi:hypothetical protein
MKIGMGSKSFDGNDEDMDGAVGDVDEFEFESWLVSSEVLNVVWAVVCIGSKGEGPVCCLPRAIPFLHGYKGRNMVRVKT